MQESPSQPPSRSGGLPQGRGVEVPRPRSLRPRRRSDYGHLPRPHLDLACKLASPLRAGPPLCDELVALVQHVFTEDEAAVARHLGTLLGRTAAQVARAEGRPVEEVEPLLAGLAFGKRAIGALGTGPHRRYHLLPVMPGMFELILVGQSPQALSPWHQRFVELFEALYESGYIGRYQHGQSRPVPAVRVLPLGRSIEAHPQALPADRLESVLERFGTFGVGQCQCRLATSVLGRGCGRPVDNCTAMGLWAEIGIAQGWLRRVSRKEVLEIKRYAESQGLVNWVLNVRSTRGQVSCSCCGCCCHTFRLVTQFSAPGVVAPPRYMPRVDPAQCQYCGRCAAVCPVQALTIEPRARRYEHHAVRCIGCGLCAVACPQRAIAMEPVAQPRQPLSSWLSLVARATPGMLRGIWHVWEQRRAL